MLYIIYLLSGIVIGAIISTFSFMCYIHKRTYGTLCQATDGEDTYLFLDLDKEPRYIMKTDKVVFKVNKNKITSHE